MDREDLRYQFRSKTGYVEKDLGFVSQHKVIVYGATKKTTEEVAETLNRMKARCARYYHCDVSPKGRIETLHNLKQVGNCVSWL